MTQRSAHRDTEREIKILSILMNLMASSPPFTSIWCVYLDLSRCHTEEKEHLKTLKQGIDEP